MTSGSDIDLKRIEYMADITYYSEYLRCVIIEWIMNGRIDIGTLFMRRVAVTAGPGSSRRRLYYGSTLNRKDTNKKQKQRNCNHSNNQTTFMSGTKQKIGL